MSLLRIGPGLTALLMMVTGCGGNSALYRPSPTISVAPSVISLASGSTAQFTTTIYNATNKAVQWSVMEGAVGGSINATGLYTAPKTTGTYHVVAKTLATPIAAATATVNVVTSVSRYTVTDLGSAAFPFSLTSPNSTDPGYDEVTAVNSSGIVVGTNGGEHAVLWSGGVMKDLGTLGGPNSVATAVNASGQVVGEATTSGPTSTLPGATNTHAFLYTNGTMQDLGFAGRATGINAAGEVVGYIGGVADTRHAFLYANGTKTDLGVLPGGQDSAATGINASGQIVGYSTVNGVRHAFLYSNGRMQDLGIPPGYSQSQALAINDQGQIAGTLDNTSEQHLFLYTNGGFQNLGSLSYSSSNGVTPYQPEAVASINSSGQIVVFLPATFSAASPLTRNTAVFLYSGGVLQDLHGLFAAGSVWNPITASGINDAGQITGTGYNGGNYEAFLMTPQ